MFCPKCGTKNAEGSHKCIICGRLLPKSPLSNNHKSNRLKKLLLWGTIPILAIIILGVYFKFRSVDRENETPTPQIGNQLGKCILTTSINSEDVSQLGSNQSEPGSSSPGDIILTEDTGGCLKFAGDIIHFTLNSGEVGGTATIDIGDVHKDIPLYDDGTHGDKTADDGVYENSYETQVIDVIRSGTIVGYYQPINTVVRKEIFSYREVSIANWNSKSNSVDPKVHYISDPITGNRYDPNRVIITFKEDATSDNILKTLDRLELRISSWLSAIKVFEIELSPDQKYSEIVEELNESGYVENVKFNTAMESLGIPQPIPDVMLPIDQANYINIIRAKLGWSITAGKNDVEVAVIDSGVNFKHEDLKNQIIAYTVPGLTDTEDIYGHGTQVAGLIAAEKGNIGISGIAPNVKLRVYKSGNYGSIDLNEILLIAYILEATDAKARIINISQCDNDYSLPLHIAIRYAYKRNVVLIAGIGEEDQNGKKCGGKIRFFKDWEPGINKVYPASFSEVLAVGASEIYDTIAVYSGFGDQVIYAPVSSKGIWTTENTGSYSLVAGTSFAVPQVVALAALIISKDTNLSNNRVIEIIATTTDSIQKTPEKLSSGLGRINVYRALMVASGEDDPGENPLPTEITHLQYILNKSDPPSVLLTWTPPGDADYQGVNIYRKNLADGSIVLLEGGLITGSEYKDQQIFYGETYQYYVFSVDSLGQESVDYLATINIRIDPPPSMIAFLRDGNIWAMNEDGSEEKQLTYLDLARPDFLQSYYWSPDGTKIAFPYYPSPGYQNPHTISIISTDSSNQIDIPNYFASHMDDFSDISWLPDSQSIAFTNKTDEFHYDVYTVRKDGSNLNNYTNNQKTGYVSFIAWSPDESHMAFRSNIETHGFEDLFIMNLPDKSMVNVTNIPENELQDLIIHAVAAFPHLISWSPNGDLLAFAGLAQGTPYCGAIGTPADCKQVQNIFLATDEGKSLRNLTGPKGYDGRYDWSPEGKRIAFETNRDGNWEIYVINIDGSSLINLTNNPAEDRSPSWAPDGESIVFVSDRDGNQEIYRIELESGSQVRITNTEGSELLPAYRPVVSIETITPTSAPSTSSPLLQDLDLTNPNDVITWFSNGLKSTDIQFFEKIFTEDTLLYGTGMATEGGRDEIARETFLQELAMRLSNHPTCVGYTVDIENNYLTIWTQGWQPKWNLLGKPFSDVLTFSLFLKNGKVSLTAYFTPGPAILGLPNIKSLPCP